MTEYDFSPAAYERHLATQRRIADWVDRTEAHRPLFGNALKVPPSVGSVAAPDDPRTTPAHHPHPHPQPTSISQRPSARRHRSSDTLRTFCSVARPLDGAYDHGTTTVPQRPPNRRHHSSDALSTFPKIGGTHAHADAVHRSQPASRSSSRHRSHGRERSASRRRDAAYVVAGPQVHLVGAALTVATQAYVYAQGRGVVVVPPGAGARARDVGASLVLPPQQQAYQPSALGPGIPQTYIPQAVYPSTAYPQPALAQMYAGAPYPPQTQAPGPTPLRPEMFQPGFDAGGVERSGHGYGHEHGHGQRKGRKLRKSVSEVWFRV